MKKSTVFFLCFGAVVLFLSAFLFSCGSDKGGNSSTGTVALYMTDDMSDYSGVIATINRVQLLNSGSGAVCDVYDGSVTLDLSNLSDVMQFIKTASCGSGSYNRIHIEFEKSVTLSDSNDNTDTCSFVSYKDDHGSPNALSCNGDICTLDINGGVNVLANQNNGLALDFDLKEFEVEGFGSDSCSVTMKVSPLNASGMGEKERHGYLHGITGYISDLTGTTFKITGRDRVFLVDYSDVSQEGLADLLDLAVNDNLKVSVKASAIDLDSNTITASAIVVKVEGTVSDLDEGNHLFTLTYQGTKTIGVDYTDAVEVEGNIADGAEAEVKLTGFNGTDYLAHKVEMGEEETED